MKDPLIFSFLLAMFGLMGGCIAMQFTATSGLAKWLCRNRPEVWRELGRPGTTFFKGDPDNGYLSRTSALQLMHRIMPLQAYRRELAEAEAERYLRNHRLFGRLGLVFFILFGVGMLCGIHRHESRTGGPSDKSDSNRREQASPSANDHRSN